MTECSQPVDDTSEVISRLEAIYAQLPDLGCIAEILAGDLVYGSDGQLHRVTATASRWYEGPIVNVRLVPRAEAARMLREVEALSVAATGACRSPRR